MITRRELLGWIVKAPMGIFLAKHLPKIPHEPVTTVVREPAAIRQTADDIVETLPKVFLAVTEMRLSRDVRPIWSWGSPASTGYSVGRTRLDVR